jgi:ABC-type amino acid transport substrate-binding protein
MAWSCYGVSGDADRDRIFRMGYRAIIVRNYVAKTAFRYHRPPGPSQNDLGAIVVPVKEIDEAIEKLLEHQVDAVVFDSPTILYYARNEAAGKVAVVGNLFDIQYYGFLFPQGSELREAVNRALLKLHHTGQYEKIFNKWFGAY